MQHLDALGVLFEILHGVLAALGAPVYVQFEAHVARVGVFHQILPHDLVAVLEFVILARVVVVTQHETVFGRDLADAVEIVAHLLQTRLGVVDAVTRNDEVAAAARLLYLEKLTPASLDLGLLGGILLNARVGRHDLHAVVVAQRLEVGGSHSEYLGVASPLHQFDVVVAQIGQTLDRGFGILLHCRHDRIELDADLLVLLGRRLMGRDNCRQSRRDAYARKDIAQNSLEFHSFMVY